MLVTFALSTTSGTSELLLAYDSLRGGGAYGPSIAVDICFPYYQQHPVAEVCQAIRAQGFTCAHLVDYGAAGSSLDRLKPWADGFRAAKVSPVLCIYPGTHSALYRAHPEWRQKMLTGIDGRCDWRTYLCPNQPGFVKAYCEDLEAKMREVGFEGVQLAEIWFENWGGPMPDGKPNPRYACVCEACLARFRALTGVDPRPLLMNAAGLGLPEAKQRALYKTWVDMRVQTIQEYGRSILETVRRANPRACVKVMYMADARVKLDGGREYLGNDLDRMVREWQPDVLTLEDAWQDWGQQGLRTDFLDDYARAYKARLEKLRPGIFVMSHADIGSRRESRRSVEWIRRFAADTVRVGFGAPCFYEWQISSLSVAQGTNGPVPTVP